MPKGPLPKVDKREPGARRRMRGRSLAIIAVIASLGLVSDARFQSLDAESKAAHHGPIVSIEANGETIQAAGASVVIAGSAESIEAAGARVQVSGDIAGGLDVAGAEVTIDSNVGGDLRAAGASVEVIGTVDGKAYVAGATVKFDAAAKGDVSLGGASVTIGSESSIAGDLTAGGASVIVNGSLAGAADIGGAAVVFNGSADGPLMLYGDLITIGSSAQIKGDVTVVSEVAPAIESGASIGGQVVREEPSRWWVLPNWLWAVIAAVAVAAGTIIAGMVLLLIGRGTFESGLSKATFQPVSSGFLGLAVLVLLPIATIILMTTLIGTTIGIAMFLTLPFLLVAGHALVSACIGIWLFDRVGEPRTPGRIVLFLIVGAVIVAAISMIPFIGWIFAVVVGLIGVGAYTRSLFSRMSHSDFAARV